MIWECKNYEWYENVKIMNDMRMQNYEWYENCKIMSDMRIAKLWVKNENGKNE